MRTRNHIIASAGISLGIKLTTHSWPATAACFFSGILIDVDHYLEYYIFRGKLPGKYQDLVEFCNFSPNSKVYLVFHAYEYMILFWFLIFYFHLGALWLGLAVGLTTHLMMDQFTNPIKPLFYFLTFRIMEKFDKSKILSEAYFKRSHP